MGNIETITKPSSVAKNGNKKALDRKAILDLAGKFHVTFDFAETFSPDKNYKQEKLYKNESIEYIFVIKDEPNLISLQHILVINDRFVVKHWRQDWVYENRDLLLFYKEGVWKKKTISEEEAEGTWTQKVYQVDDSPRYQSYGTWVFVDGKRYWEATADAPLPRRQEHRTDYNVLVRNSRVELTTYGWIMNQDNQKVFRDDNGKDKLIVWEKGFEVQNRGDYNIQPALDYWSKTQNYWADVRAIWAEIFEDIDELKLKEVVDGKHLYDWFFEFANQFSGDNYDEELVNKTVSSTIDQYRL